MLTSCTLLDWVNITTTTTTTTLNPSLSYVTPDGQSVSLSWCQAPIWGLRPDFYYFQTVSWWVALSLTRGRVCRLQLLLTLASVAIFGSESRGTRDHIYCLRFETSLSVASYYSQRYGGGIRPLLQTWLTTLNAWINSVYNFQAAGIEVTMSYSSSVLLSREPYFNS
jgi:hypothetical protein